METTRFARCLSRSAAVALAAAAVAAAIAQADSASGPGPAARPGPAGRVVEATNAERARHQRPALIREPQLDRLAQAHADDMARRGYFSHTSPDGVTFAERIRRLGFPVGASGENIALGQRSAAEALRSWMGSKGHRENILNPRFRFLGVGHAVDARGRAYWVQVFAEG